MLIDRRSLGQHLPWIIIALAVTALATLWYFVESAGKAQWPGGGSAPGFACGVLGGALMLFEFALWGRKKLRVKRIGRAQTWMAAHIWLGLLTVPLMVYHSGFRLGGTLSATLMGLFAIVILSGIWGIILQQIIPRIMLRDVPAETIYSQIGPKVLTVKEEAEDLVNATCGSTDAVGETGAATSRSQPALITVGAVRRIGLVSGKVIQTKVPTEPVEGSEAIRPAYFKTIAPFLDFGSRIDSPLNQPVRATAYFQDLRGKVPVEAHETVNALESVCEQRRQWDRQARLHFWLHNWLCVHLPLSVALILLMFVHIFSALRFW